MERRRRPFAARVSGAFLRSFLCQTNFWNIPFHSDTAIASFPFAWIAGIEVLSKIGAAGEIICIFVSRSRISFVTSEKRRLAKFRETLRGPKTARVICSRLWPRAWKCFGRLFFFWDTETFTLTFSRAIWGEGRGGYFEISRQSRKTRTEKKGKQLSLRGREGEKKTRSGELLEQLLAFCPRSYMHPLDRVILPENCKSVGAICSPKMQSYLFFWIRPGILRPTFFPSGKWPLLSFLTHFHFNDRSELQR